MDTAAQARHENHQERQDPGAQAGPVQEGGLHQASGLMIVVTCSSVRSKAYICL